MNQTSKTIISIVAIIGITLFTVACWPEIKECNDEVVRNERCSRSGYQSVAEMCQGQLDRAKQKQRAIITTLVLGNLGILSVTAILCLCLKKKKE